VPQPKPKVELDLNKLGFSSTNEMEGNLAAKVLEKVEDLKYYQQDAKQNFMKEMPLSLKIERF